MASDIQKFITQKLAAEGDDLPHVFVITRDDGSTTSMLESVRAQKGADEAIESAIRDELREAHGKLEFTIQAQAKDGRLIAARTFRRRGLAQGDQVGARLESKLVDLVGNVLERTAEMQSSLYDRQALTIEKQEKLICAQNETLLKLVESASEHGGSQDAGSKYAMDRMAEIAGKAIPLLGTVMSRNMGGAPAAPAAPVTGGKYGEIRSAIAALTDEDLEGVVRWVKKADVGQDILMALTEESRNSLITVITSKGL